MQLKLLQESTPVSVEGDASSAFLQNNDIEMSHQPSDNEQNDSTWQPESDSSSSSSSEHLMPGPANPNTEAITKQTRKQREIASKNRVLGKDYVGYQDRARPARKVKERCSHTTTTPKSTRTFMCATVTQN